MKFNHFFRWTGFAVILSLAIFVAGIGTASAASDNSDVINEKYGQPIVVYGSALSPAQKEEVRSLLKVTDPSMVKEITVTGDDLVTYIKGDRNANLYSSAKITRKDPGTGIVINQVTPGNITEVTNAMYANALFTAGIQDAVVDIASPVKVTGHSALVGIYKAYDTGNGTGLNKDRTQVANEELNLATNLAKKDGMNPDKVSELLTAIKQQMAAQNPASKEDIANIVDDKLKSMNISLSPSDRQLLIDLFDKMRGLNINFGNVKSQLGSLTQDIQNRIGKAVSDNKGFLQAVADFFQKLIDSIKSIFS